MRFSDFYLFADPYLLFIMIFSPIKFHTDENPVSFTMQSLFYLPTTAGTLSKKKPKPMDK